MLAFEDIKRKIIDPLSYRVENVRSIIGIICALKASAKGESPDVISEIA